MPTYEYECSNCGHKFEAFQSITAQPLKKCPQCSKKITRLIGAGGGIIFKGPGFYATDYRKQNAKKEAPGACQSCPSANTCTSSQQ